MTQAQKMESTNGSKLDVSDSYCRCRKLSLHRPSHFPEAVMVQDDEIETVPATPQPVSPSASSSSTPKSVTDLVDPAAILMNPHYNKDAAFSEKERGVLRLRGLLPNSVEDINVQVQRCYEQFNRFTEPMSKYIYLMSLKERNETLFYRLLVNNLFELMPFVYTPTVGQACQEFDLQFRHAEGMYIGTQDKGQIRRMLNNWRPNILDEVSIIVVTDGSRILGLGDLGACGMGIPIGKLALYVAAGGFHPATALPVVIDVGTNNKALLEDKFYLGERHERVGDEEFYGLMEEFVTAVKDKWPTCLVQFEDFSNNHCFDLLHRYQQKMLCFNDDIQGTGAVIAAGLLNAVKIAKVDPKDIRCVFLGAGAAGIGVADQIRLSLEARYGISKEETYKSFYLVDSKGLVTANRGDELASHKLPYARKDVEDLSGLNSLKGVIQRFKPNVLVGLSGQPQVFDAEVLRLMAEINERPIIFPLSNPTKKAECTAEEAFRETGGRVVFASGSPFPTLDVNGRSVTPSQGNNLYTFPGLGFGAWLCRSKMVTDEMITAATIALADCTTQEELEAGRLYPDLNRIRDVSVDIAAAVIETAKKQGHCQAELQDDLKAFVKNNMYQPDYLEWKPTH